MKIAPASTSSRPASIRSAVVFPEPDGRDADAVDPGAADDGDAPAALGPGAQDGEGVVADARPLRPAAARDRGAQLLLLAREVDARHEELRDRRDGAVARAARVA